MASALSFFSCATLRSNPVLPIDFASQPPRAIIRGNCDGHDFTTQGVVVCEQKGESTATISVKVPPLEGRVVYSNGQLKKIDDFNWYPKEGFFIWKSKPIKDTWADLDLGEIAATFGDWPVALDIVASSDVGIIDTRGILYHRICNDKDIPCSTLVVQYDCAGEARTTGPGSIGKCQRLSGSPQAFTVSLSEAKPGAKLYIVTRRLGVKQSVPIAAADLGSGFKKIEVPAIPPGPTLIDFALDWWDGDTLKHKETRVLVVGFDPTWTGLDRPHWLDRGQGIDFAKPVFSDMAEVDLYQGRQLLEKRFGVQKVYYQLKPREGQTACAFAWQRDSADLTALCLDQNMQEVPVP
jgi:hypothetical protein